MMIQKKAGFSRQPGPGSGCVDTFFMLRRRRRWVIMLSLPQSSPKDSTQGDCGFPLPPLFSVSLVRLANIRNLHC